MTPKEGFDERGRFAKGNQLGTKITSETQHLYAKRRVEKAKEDALMALNDAAAEGGLYIPKAVIEHGWYAVIYHLTSVLLNSDNPKGLAELAKLIGQSSGNLSDRNERVEQDGDMTVSSEVKKFINDLATIVRSKQKEEEDENTIDIQPVVR